MDATLFSPIKINSLTLANRIVLPPITMNFAEDGAVSDRDIAYHASRAAGGCGLNIIDGALVENDKYGFRLALDDDRFIEPLARLAEAVHQRGGKVGIQLLHHGRAIPPGLGLGRERLVSVVPGLTSNRPDLVLNQDTMAQVKASFVAAAVRAQQAGMDMVELSGGHGYLLAQFFSPLTNKRKDAYGGSLENRMRFPLEILEGIREALGKEYPISVRLSVDEMYAGGLQLADTLEICRSLVENHIDMISLSASIRESYEYCMPPACIEHAWLAPKAAEIRRGINEAVPIMVSGRITDCRQAEAILQKHEADLVGMGRALIANPHLPRDCQEGKAPIFQCLGCNIGCTDNLNKHRAVSCAINPVAGQEYLYPDVKAPKQLHVTIVGGGPAGMQAAVTAAKRGHKVKLIEKKNKLGGRMDVVAIPPFKSEYLAYADSLAQEVRRRCVDVKLGSEATIDGLLSDRSDAVILATGSIPLIPRFCAEADAITAEEALKHANLVGKKVLVLGGGAVGAETAEYLAERGHGVRIIELREQLAPDMEWRGRKFLLERLQNANVEICLNTKITSIVGKKVTVENPDGREESYGDADTIVLAMGYKPFDPLGDKLEEAGVRVFRIGDCRAPGLVYAATHDALQVAYAL